jgi:DNA-directed RNA polymerase subunit RPC12/RpoP
MIPRSVLKAYYAPLHEHREGSAQIAIEDLNIQLDSARKSIAEGRYATAKAELNGAIMILDAIPQASEVECPNCGHKFLPGWRTD